MSFCRQSILSTKALNIFSSSPCRKSTQHGGMHLGSPLYTTAFNAVKNIIFEGGGKEKRLIFLLAKKGLKS